MANVVQQVLVSFSSLSSVAGQGSCPRSVVGTKSCKLESVISDPGPVSTAYLQLQLLEASFPRHPGGGTSGGGGAPGWGRGHSWADRQAPGPLYSPATSPSCRPAGWRSRSSLNSWAAKHDVRQGGETRTDWCLPNR